ncbi:MAG: FadR family transcriptional regulator [Anaerolineales bacterium]|nr:MAG: FadR family transcriptional regulator [Anaerolineales bacterium]
MVSIAKPQRVNLTRQCLNSIQDYIATNRLKPGSKLPSLQEWADMLEVSLVVVREAFRALQALGLVDIQHGRGIYVCSLDEMNFLSFLSFRFSLDQFSLEEVIEARAMLELAILETCIARATPILITELEQIVDELRVNPPLAGIDSDLHKRFHQTMLKASGDRLLASIGMPLLNTFWTLGNNGKIQLPEEVYGVDMVLIHAAYIDAIKRRDFSQTRDLVDRHLFGLCSKYHVYPFAGPVVEADEAAFKSKDSV